MHRPDFLIIGAMKSGTSTLQAQLARQPGVFMTTPKEPNFFSDDAIYAKGLDWYSALYDGAAPDDLKGEASTHYTKLPTYPQTLSRLTAVVEAPKLIYMIRNPVERAVSHYIHEWSEARMRDDPITAFAQHPELVAYGQYAMQIRPYIDAYGAESICLTSLERIKTAPDAELARIGAFLELPAPARWDHDMGAQNVSAERARKFPLQSVLIDNPVARTLRRSLVPKAVRTRIRDGRTIGARPELPDGLRSELQEVFARDREDLAKLFPGDPVLTDTYPFVPA